MVKMHVLSWKYGTTAWTNVITTLYTECSVYWTVKLNVTPVNSKAIPK